MKKNSLRLIITLFTLVNAFAMLAQKTSPSIVGEWCSHHEWQDKNHTNFVNYVYVFTADGNIECRQELGTKGVYHGNAVVEIWGDQERISEWKEKSDPSISSVECLYSLQYNYDKSKKVINVTWEGALKGQLPVISLTDTILILKDDGETITLRRRSSVGKLHFKY